MRQGRPVAHQNVGPLCRAFASGVGGAQHATGHARNGTCPREQSHPGVRLLYMHAYLGINACKASPSPKPAYWSEPHGMGKGCKKDDMAVGIWRLLQCVCVFFQKKTKWC